MSLTLTSRIINMQFLKIFTQLSYHSLNLISNLNKFKLFKKKLIEYKYYR